MRLVQVQVNSVCEILEEGKPKAIIEALVERQTKVKKKTLG